MGEPRYGETRGLFVATMVFGAVARSIGIIAFGTPNFMSLALLGIELTGAPMWPWQTCILRTVSTI